MSELLAVFCATAVAILLGRCAIDVKDWWLDWWYAPRVKR